MGQRRNSSGNRLEVSFRALAGRFVGRGVNHEGQAFTGIFEGATQHGVFGMSFTFQAVGDDGAVFHSESSILGRSMTGTLGLWVLSSNHPGVFQRNLIQMDSFSGGGVHWTFGFGEKSDQTAFREEVRIQVRPQESVIYAYSWGMPGGEFAERSSVRMKNVSAKLDRATAEGLLDVGEPMPGRGRM